MNFMDIEIPRKVVEGTMVEIKSETVAQCRAETERKNDSQ